MVNRYVMDPARVVPARQDATSNGHFPIGNNVPTGTPRGFNLQSMGQSGPMRREGGRYNNNRQGGPYDRSAGQSRGMRWNNSGRLSPRGGRGRFPDAQQGGVMAPREAVAGRSLKSYEDLDAADSKPKEDLDY